MFKEFEFISQIESKLKGRPYPVWGQFELLPVCNLRCLMCYVHDTTDNKQSIKNLLPASFWIDIARQAVKSGMLVLSITGGEPLLYPELDELLEALSRMGLIISLNTNGTLIDESQIARLSKYAISKINLSLYGASDETYLKLTGCPDGFSRICHAIELLKEAGQNIYLNAVLTPENKDDLSKMINYAELNGLVLHGSAYMFPRREQEDGYKPNKYRFSPEEAAKAHADYLRIIRGEQAYRVSCAALAFREHTFKKAADRLKRRAICRAGRYEFAVDWHGNLLPCIMFPAIYEDLKAHSFSHSWNSCIAKMQNMSFPEKCLECSHLDTCPVCRAAVYLETNTYDTAPEYLCRYSEEMFRIWEREGEGIKIHMEVPDTIVNISGFRGCEK